MPLFDFECQSCSKIHEELILGSPGDLACPYCGSSNLRRLLGAPAPPGKSKSLIAAARRQAAAEGNLSNFSTRERKRLLE